MTEIPNLGPVSQCTLIASDGEAAVAAYSNWLYTDALSSESLDSETAAAIGYPQLAGAPSWLLANTAGRQWLHIVECKSATPSDSLQCFGWMALEVLVADVDALARRLEKSPFEILRPPANLDISDRIRACQVRGPCSEVLYLTQVDGEIAGFDLPTCEAPVDRLFIPVLSTPSRDDSLAQYTGLAGAQGMCFDTRVTVVNQARGFDLARRHPVATLQLAGQSLLELDEIADTRPPGESMHQGMACVALNSATGGATLTPSSGPFAGRGVSPHTGRAGEHFVLIHP